MTVSPEVQYLKLTKIQRDCLAWALREFVKLYKPKVIDKTIVNAVYKKAVGLKFSNIKPTAKPKRVYKKRGKLHRAIPDVKP